MRGKWSTKSIPCKRSRNKKFFCLFRISTAFRQGVFECGISFRYIRPFAVVGILNGQKSDKKNEIEALEHGEKIVEIGIILCGAERIYNEPCDNNNSCI